jgi:hypothetical protein
MQNIQDQMASEDDKSVEDKSELSREKDVVRKPKSKLRSNSFNIIVDVDELSKRNNAETNSANTPHDDYKIKSKYSSDSQNNSDDESIESDDEEDEDEINQPRSFTLEEIKEIDENSANKKAILASKNQMSAAIRGTFTCKIVKKKAQDIDKGKVVAFGSTAMRSDDVSNQQILERKQKIQKHYQGPYKKKKQHSVLCAAPKNLNEQKQLFFESECTYNPQFIYDNENTVRKY